MQEEEFDVHELTDEERAAFDLLTDDERVAFITAQEASPLRSAYVARAFKIINDSGDDLSRLGDFVTKLNEANSSGSRADANEAVRHAGDDRANNGARATTDSGTQAQAAAQAAAANEQTATDVTNQNTRGSAPCQWADRA